MLPVHEPTLEETATAAVYARSVQAAIGEALRLPKTHMSATVDNIAAYKFWKTRAATVHPEVDRGHPDLGCGAVSS